MYRKGYIFDKFQYRFPCEGGSLLKRTYEVVHGLTLYCPGQCLIHVSYFDRSVLFFHTSSTEDVIAVATGTALYLYSGSLC